MLLSADKALLQQALALLQAGRALEVPRLLSDLSSAARAQPDALYVGARTAEMLEQIPEAMNLFNRALAGAPHNAGFWNSQGNLLNRIGDHDGALASYQRAAALQPGYFDAWLNIAIVGVAAAQNQLAEAALATAAQLAPHDARMHAVAGMLETARGRPGEAAVAFVAALAINPRDARSRHNLAAALRSQAQWPAALVEVEQAMRDGLTGPETATLRAHLLAENGRFEEAVAQYRAVIESVPGYLDAQQTLALLLPQLGRHGEALAGFAKALVGGADAAFWLAAINIANALGEGAVMLQWVMAAETAHGARLDWQIARISALRLLGCDAEAVQVALFADQQSPIVRTHLAFLYLQSGALAEAQDHALAATQLAPQDQTGWALLTLIWRLAGDRREAWLADYDRLVMVSDLAVPPGWSSLSAYMTDLSATLNRLHLTRQAPAEQSLRGGTQTRGNLFDTTDPVLLALQRSLVATVECCLSRLQPDPTHPFLSLLANGITMVGSWSVRLTRQGFHVSHIHPSGWLSSAFYVALPDDIAAGETTGALMFGVPDAALGIDLSPRRVVTPRVGQLVIFPSYFWHSTAPFDSSMVRMSVAFDALPTRG